MNNKLIIEFILREINDLETMARSLSEDEDYSPLLVDIAVTKAKNLYQEFLLLSEKNPLPSAADKIGNQPGMSKQDLIDKILSTESAKAGNESLNINDFHLGLIPQDEEDYPLDEEDSFTGDAQHIPSAERNAGSSDLGSGASFDESDETSDENNSFEDQVIEPTNQSGSASSTSTTESQATERQTTSGISDQIPSEERELDKEESEFQMKDTSFYSREQRNQEQLDNDFFSAEKDSKSGIRFPIQDLHSAIGLNDQYLFIRELFNNDPDFYNRSIAYINSCTSIHEAVEFMKENFHWKKNEASKRFLELVKRRFS